MSELVTINAETLYYMPLKKTEFLVERLLPKGLSILAGPSKCGKSWLALFLAHSIALGEPVWGRCTVQGDVLYLALEDTAERLQGRLHTITDKPAGNLELGVVADNIGDGLSEQIVAHIQKYPNTKLVIIDTLQKVRRKSGNNALQYANDYDDLSKVKEIADSLSIAILLIHHTRKTADNIDPFNEISGSTGIMGTADECFVMKKDARFSEKATLYITGRDVEQQELRMLFQDKRWEVEEELGPQDFLQEQIPEFIFRLVDFIKEQKQWKGTMAELLAEMNENEVIPNKASKYIAAYYGDALEPASIRYTSTRLAKGRVFSFSTSVDSADGVDEFYP